MAVFKLYPVQVGIKEIQMKHPSEGPPSSGTALLVASWSPLLSLPTPRGASPSSPLFLLWCPSGDICVTVSVTLVVIPQQQDSSTKKQLELFKGGNCFFFIISKTLFFFILFSMFCLEIFMLEENVSRFVDAENKELKTAGLYLSFCIVLSVISR